MGIPIISAADPVIDLAVDIGGGNVQRLQLYEGNNIDNSVTSFMQKFSLPASAKAVLVSSVQQQADAIFQANQAAAKEKQAAAAAAQLEPITFDISITVPLKYIPGTDINIAAREFCDRHGLDPSATVPAIIDLARQQLAAKNQAAAEKAAAEKAAAEKAAAEKAAAQAATRKLVATLPLNIAGKQVSVQLYEGDVVNNVAANVCQSLGLNAADYHQPLVDTIAAMVRKL